jgi:hypothetical protein
MIHLSITPNIGEHPWTDLKSQCPVIGEIERIGRLPAGIDVVAFESPLPPKLTRSQKRYRDFLSSDCGYSFREWLQLCEDRRKNPEAYA